MELIDIYIELKLSEFTLGEMPTAENNFNVYLGFSRVVNIASETTCGTKLRLHDLDGNVLIRSSLGYKKKYKIFRTIDEIFDELNFLVSKW
jgi:phage terminase large subunit-like protein